MVTNNFCILLHRSKGEEAKSKNESISNYKYYFHDDKMYNLYLFIGATLFSVLLNMCSSLSFFWLTVNSSKNLHNKMLQALLKATMYFFDSTPLGMYDVVHLLLSIRAVIYLTSTLIYYFVSEKSHRFFHECFPM